MTRNYRDFSKFLRHIAGNDVLEVRAGEIAIRGRRDKGEYIDVRVVVSDDEIGDLLPLAAPYTARLLEMVLVPMLENYASITAKFHRTVDYCGSPLEVLSTPDVGVWANYLREHAAGSEDSELDTFDHFQYLVSLVPRD